MGRSRSRSSQDICSLHSTLRSPRRSPLGSSASPDRMPPKGERMKEGAGGHCFVVKRRSDGSSYGISYHSHTYLAPTPTHTTSRSHHRHERQHLPSGPRSHLCLAVEPASALAATLRRQPRWKQRRRSLPLCHFPLHAGETLPPFTTPRAALRGPSVLGRGRVRAALAMLRGATPSHDIMLVIAPGNREGGA